MHVTGEHGVIRTDLFSLHPPGKVPFANPPQFADLLDHRIALDLAMDLALALSPSTAQTTLEGIELGIPSDRYVVFFP
ncbi:hypothetical protein KSX_95280 [Ktedonospora formicarum]|uniref:Uncharacterized protein n=1 Tax=Ktedonospora formicarum TaxID=2778364 RepID=A0A8J3N020_9CHLR|nr:hypothetical protein KSX_95280 [Ktedonospora formicarum]